MIKAIAIDDEPLALDVIETYCGQVADIDLLDTFTSQSEALEYLNRFDVDLVFLDIQMPKSNGIQLYTSLTKPIKVVFTTAYGQYAVEGFNLNASDYLLKPFSLERFSVAVEKVKKEIYLENSAASKRNHLVVRADYKLHNIPFEEIIFIEALDDYIKIHLRNNHKIVTRHTMKGILDKLPSNDFKRAHRSYIISLKKVRTLNKDSAVVQGFTIPLSPTYKEDILRYFNN